MTLQKPFSSPVWIFALVLSAAFVAALTVHRVRRVVYVSSLAGGAEMAVHSGPSQQGTAVLPRLIVPERNERSFDVLARVRRMWERKQWRVRHVDFENAPQGHEVMATSPYAWWVGTIARIDQRMTGNPFTTSVGRASLWADPLAQLLFLIVLTLVVAQQWGGGAGAAFSLGCAGLYPFAAAFWPGAPDPQAMARLLGLASVLLIAIGLTQSTASGKWFVGSGVLAGLALWVDVPMAMLLLAGIMVGHGLSVGLIRGGDDRTTNETGARSCWRVWGLAGATTVLIGYVIEYAPAYLGLWHLETVHPLYGVAWLGAGELMTQLENWRHHRVARFSRGNVFSLVLGTLAIAALPVTLSLSGSRGYIVRDLLSLRLTNEPGGAVATDFWSWVARDGLNARVLATLLPLLGLLLLAWWTRTTPGDPSRRRVLAIVAGPLLVALGVATRQLSAWTVVDGALLILITAGIATTRTTTGRMASSRVLAWGLLIACLTIPGAVQLWPRGRADASLVLTASEAEELIERDLARWLRMRAVQEDAVIFAPPRETVTLAHYGGFRGIGTFSAENTKGFGTSLMIAGVQTMEEVQALLQPRAVRYIIVPSWDPFFDEFGQLYLAKNFSNRKSFFIGELRRGNLPRWLRPLAYPMPEIPGFERQSVLVFEVVDEQNPAVAASRLAEYFVETGELDRAASVAAGLRRFPGDVSALTAQAQVSGARDDDAGFEQAVTGLQSRLANGGDRYLPWDRRVALAVVLARAGKIDTAKEQALRCWAEANGSKMKALSAGSLFGLLVLGDTFKADIDPPLRSLALELLPAGLRARL